MPRLVMLLVLLSAGLAAAGNDGIVVEAYSGKRPDDAAKAVAPLLEELAQRGFASGLEVARRYEARVSKAAGAADNLPIGFADQVDRGTKAWALGKFEDAVNVLGPLVDAAHEASGAFLDNTKLRDALLRALTVLALSQHRLGDPGTGNKTFDEIIRSFPDATVAKATYGPDAAALFATAQKTAAAAPKGRLLVKLADEQTEVFINERLERKGTTVKELLPGNYRIVAQAGSTRSRVHRIAIKAGEEITLTIDPAFDAALRTDGWAGFAFANAADRETSEAPYAAALAKAIDGNAVVVISLDSIGGRRSVVGSLVLMNGKEIRRASIALDPAPTNESVASLAKFLAGEKVAVAGFDVQLDGPIPVLLGTGGTGPAPVRDTGGGRWGGWPVITGAGALIAIGIGGYFALKDGKCKDGTDNPNCPDLYAYKPHFIGSFAGGAVLAGITIYLIVSKPSPPARQAFVIPADGGAIAGVAGRW